MKTTPLIVTILSLTTAVLGAQELSLNTAVDTALADNPEVFSARERSAAAGERYNQVKGRRLPELNLSESFVYTNNPAEVFAMSLNQGRFDMEEFFLSDPNNPDPLSTWITSVELVLPIYTGGVLSARTRQTEVMATAEERDYAHTRQRVAFDTITAYVDLAKAREHVTLLEKARNTTAEHVRLAEMYAAQGVILEADLLQSKVYLAEVDDLLTQAGNGASLAQASLNFQMGANQAVPRALAPLPPPDATGGDLEDWTLGALEDRQDLRAARMRLEAGRLEEKAAKPGYLPEIAVRGHYDLYDDTIFGSHGHSGSVMAFAKINLYRGGSNGAAKAAARHETASFEADIRRFEEGVRLEVQQGWLNLATANTRHETAVNALAAAKEALRVRDRRFKQGLDKMIDLLDAETSLREAETRELVARFDVALNTYRLKYVSGSTLIDSMEE